MGDTHMRLNACRIWETVRLVEGREAQFADRFFKSLSNERPSLFRKVANWSKEDRHDLLVTYLNALLRPMATPGTLVLTVKAMRRMADEAGMGDEDMDALHRALEGAVGETVGHLMDTEHKQAWSEGLQIIMDLLNAEQMALPLAS